MVESKAAGTTVRDDATSGVSRGCPDQVPYMPKTHLRHEIDSGVRFFGWEEGGEVVGVMGIQDVQDVTLIRHAYVRTANRKGGIGGKLLGELRKLTARPVLIGTWAAATWAIRFYEKHGFRMVTPEEKDRLLKKYWSISKRQIETSVVLAEEKWFTDSAARDTDRFLAAREFTLGGPPSTSAKLRWSSPRWPRKGPRPR